MAGGLIPAAPFVRAPLLMSGADPAMRTPAPDAAGRPEGCRPIRRFSTASTVLADGLPSAGWAAPLGCAASTSAAAATPPLVFRSFERENKLISAPLLRCDHH